MGWVASVLVAVVSGGVGLVAAGVLADQAVTWYRISSFEGGSGYFVVGLALVGGFAAFVIGLVSARVVAGSRQPGVLRALGLSMLVTGLAAVVVGGTARLLADVPPELDGETLWLQVEVKWPGGGGATRPKPEASGILRLGAARGQTIRVTRDGPLFLDDSRDEDGHLVVPGIVEIFTSRGTRVLEVLIDGESVAGFIMPTAGRPDAAALAWSDWLPHAREGAPPLPDQFAYRFRVVPISRPIRTTQVGPFRVETSATEVFLTTFSPRLAGATRFRVSADGVPLAGGSVITALAVVGASRALLARTEEGSCVLIEAAKVSSPVPGCDDPARAWPLTADVPRADGVPIRRAALGWLDRESLAAPGLYLVGTVLADTDELTLTPVSFPPAHPRVVDVPPLGLSPDRRRLAWFTYADGDEDRPAIAATEWRSGGTELVPIDRRRMRYPAPIRLDREWLGHHFEWQPGEDGADRLRERASFVPLPYRGFVQVGKPGEYQGYVIEPGSDALLNAFIEVLVADLGAVLLPDDTPAGVRRLRIGDTEVGLRVGELPSDLTVSMSRGSPDLIRRVAVTLDRALATGRYDGLIEAASTAR